MDNEVFGMQMLKNFLRSRYYNIQYMGRKIYSVKEGADILKQYLSTDQPFMFCRIGATEGRVINKWMKHRSYSNRDIQNIRTMAGLFPNNVESLDRFSHTYLSSIENADGLFTWGCIGEALAIKTYASSDVILLKNDTYNVLFYDHPWTAALKGKKILVVHPFVDTIKNQYKKRDLLFSKEILPKFESLSFVKAVQTNAGEDVDSEFCSWFDALEYMKEEISKKDFDTALIGAGAYGIPLACHVKTMGKQAIHMAGNLQILFGIRGKRWDNFPQYVPYFNEYWVYPSEHETPKQKSTVEGGSYWK